MPIAIERADGGVSIMVLIGDADADTEIAKFKEGWPGAYVSHREIALEDIPKDRSQRAGWTLGKNGIEVDPSKVPPPPVDIKKRLQALESAVIGKTPVTKADIDAQVEVVAPGDIIRK